MDNNKTENNHKIIKIEFKIIIIDLIRVSYVDESSVKCLQKIFNEYKKDGVRLLFANCNSIYIIFIIIFCFFNFF